MNPDFSKTVSFMVAAQPQWCKMHAYLNTKENCGLQLSRKLNGDFALPVFDAPLYWAQRFTAVTSTI
jgi:hypothetical protein